MFDKPFSGVPRNSFKSLINLSVVFSLALFCLRTEARAEEESVDSKPMLYISANRYPSAKEDIGSSFSTVDEGEIEATGQPTVLEALRAVPGIQVVQTGGAGRATSIFIRGNESDHTLVLIDGVRVNSNASGEFDFSSLKAENIERIEILRGPQSVLYGSEALGGVISIITKKADEGERASILASGGSFGTQEHLVKVAAAEGESHASFTVSYFDTDGFSAASENNGNTENDSHENISLSARAGTGFLEDGKVDLTIRASESEVDVDGFDFTVGAVDDPNFSQENTFLSASVNASKPVSEQLTVKLLVGATDEELEGIDPDTDFNNFIIDNQTFSVTPTLEFYPSWEGVFLLGYSFENRETENQGNFDESRDVNSFFAQKQVNIAETVTLSAGVRNDKDSDFGDETTFRTTVSAKLPDTGTRVHATFGTGFKAPSFNELFFPNFGNPDLDAETSWGFDVGVEQTLADGDVVFDITFFQSEIDDLITFDSETFLAENIDEAEIWGLESSLTLTLSDSAKATFTYSYTDTENKTTGLELARRPKHKGSLVLNTTPIEGLDVNLYFQLVNDRIESDTSKMDNYEVVDLYASYQATESVKPFVRIDNLFDEDYEEVNGFETSDFAAYGGVEVSL